MKRACLLALVAAFVATSAAQAQDSGNDPTRPPAAFAAPGGGPQSDTAVDALELQSILVSLHPGGRRLAVIGGKTVRQGDRLGDAVVETIRSTEVVLRRGKAKQTLKLFRPAVSGAGA